MIDIESVSKSYKLKTNSWLSFGKSISVPAVTDISIHIPKGEIFGLLGVNGAGKTTIARMVSTMLTPDSGRVRVDGMDTVSDRTLVQKNIGFIPSGDRLLYTRMTAQENLAYFGALYGLPRPASTKRQEHLLELVGLSDSSNKRVEQFSKGMKQRLQIARGLMHDPQVLILDEPTAGLDAPFAKDFLKLIKGMKEKTFIFTSHYMQEMEDTCDRIAIINRGKLLEVDTPQNIQVKYGNGYSVSVRFKNKIDNTLLISRIQSFRSAVTNCDNINDNDRDIRFVSALDPLPEFIHLCSELQISVETIDIKAPTLEDVVVAMTEKLR